MGDQRGRPVAYFDLNALHGAPLNRVHAMLQEVEDRVGRMRARIDITEVHDDGRYFLTFYSNDAADLFERLYRQTGKPLRRLAHLPEDVKLLNMDEAVVGLVLTDVTAFVRHMRSHLN